MTNKLSIIIVNYNGFKYLKDCFESIYNNCKSLDFEIIVVDNNSSDNSVEFIKNEFPNIILIESKKNLGFAGGNNLGVEYANGEYILLLNNDTILINDISSLMSFFTDNVGVVGIKMLSGNKEYLNSVGRFPNPFNLIKFSLFNEKRNDFVTGDFKKTNYEVDWVCGAFLLTTREIYNKVGGLDTTYFMYVEDVDFCKRVNNIGYKTLFNASNSFVHFVGFNNTRERNLINSYKIYSKKHFNFFGKKIALFSLTINYLIKRYVKNIC